MFCGMKKMMIKGGDEEGKAREGKREKKYWSSMALTGRPRRFL